MNVETLKLARRLCELSQKELADEVGVAASIVSKVENGLKSFAPDVLKRAAEVLDFPLEFFSEDLHLYNAISFHRKRQSLGAKIRDRIEAEMNLRRLHVKKLRESVDIEGIHIPDSIRDWPTPEESAIALRAVWRLHRGPIRNLTKWVEDSGVIVIHAYFGTTLLDGLTIKAPNEQPIIFLNRDNPPDRMRFTLAHELGHVLLHDVPTVTMDYEANQFAAELLMPENDIQEDLTGLHYGDLPMLKAKWRVSMAAILLRAGSLQALTASKLNQYWIWFSKAGYRRHEPVDIDPETPTLLTELIDMHRTELGYSTQELSHLLMLTENKFRQLYEPPSKPDSHLKLIRGAMTGAV